VRPERARLTADGDWSSDTWLPPKGRILALRERAPWVVRPRLPDPASRVTLDAAQSYTTAETELIKPLASEQGLPQKGFHGEGAQTQHTRPPGSGPLLVG